MIVRLRTCKETYTRNYDRNKSGSAVSDEAKLSTAKLQIFHRMARFLAGKVGCKSGNPTRVSKLVSTFELIVFFFCFIHNCAV